MAQWVKSAGSGELQKVESVLWCMISELLLGKSESTGQESELSHEESALSGN